MKIAVVKPDHLGDFILAIPAIRALLAKNHVVTLFIASGNVALARSYFPELEIVSLDLPYLVRKLDQKAWSPAYRKLGALRGFDLVFFLRRDDFFDHANIHNWTTSGFLIEDRHDIHQTQLEKAIVARVTGDFSIDRMFFQGAPEPFPRALRSVAFAIGAGFPFKKWSPLAWAELGQMLLQREARVQLLVGPGEIAEGKLIARAIGLDDARDVYVGSQDFRALKQWLQTHDLVVAADGGGAHLCSDVKPIVSVFGPSPPRRFSPTGAYNRVVTRGLSCSPCMGLHARGVNACMSRECLYGLSPTHVLAAMHLRSQPPGASESIDAQRGVTVEFGLSAAPPEIKKKQ